MGMEHGVTAIRSGRELEEARSSPRALVFLWVDWAMQAVRSRPRVDRITTAWQDRNPQLPIDVYLIDLSEQAGENWEAVQEWLRSEGKPVDLLTSGGNGALLWVREGRVVGYVAYAGCHSDDELMKRTGEAFHDR
jgi:hypothetical protein